MTKKIIAPLPRKINQDILTWTPQARAAKIAELAALIEKLTIQIYAAKVLHLRLRAASEFVRRAAVRRG